MISGNIHADRPDIEKDSISLLPAPLRKAIAFLKENDLTKHEAGRFPLDRDNMILQVLDISTSPREALRPEVHRKYIDVQFLASGGPEKIGWFPDLCDSEIDEDLLDTPRDIRFYKNSPKQRESMLEMQPGSYAVFFPWDAHIPAIQAGESARIRKIVIKVLLETCY